MLTKIIVKLTKYLELQKIIIRDDNDGGFQIPIPDEDTLSKLQLRVLLSARSAYQRMIIATSFIDSKKPGTTEPLR